MNGTTAKPAQQVRAGDEVRVRAHGRELIVTVVRPIAKRVGPPVAVACYTDQSPPPPPPEVLASIPRRDPGTGRPTKRDRRETMRLRRP